MNTEIKRWSGESLMPTDICTIARIMFVMLESFYDSRLFLENCVVVHTTTTRGGSRSRTTLQCREKAQNQSATNYVPL